MGHVHYFDVSGYFSSISYLNSLGINLRTGMVGTQVLSAADRKTLDDAIRKSEQDGRAGKLNGTAYLTQAAMDIAEKYGVAEGNEHRGKKLKDLLEEMAARPDLVKKYGLENFVARQQPEIKTNTTVSKKTRTR